MKIKKTNDSTNPLNGKIIAVIFTITILIIGTFFYFTTLGNINAAGVKLKEDSKLQEKMQPKDNPIPNTPTTYANTASKDKEESLSDTFSEIQNYSSLIDHIQQENKIYTKKDPEGYIKLFYYYTRDELIDIQLSEGDMNEYKIHSIGGQKYYPMIIGYEEAKTMREEGLFTNIGDPIKNFFGKNVVVIGILKKTESIIDTIHIIPLNNEELK